MVRVLALFAICSVLSAGRWNIVYFYDEDKSALTITDIKFPSATRGIATAILQKDGDDRQPVVLVTSDGGTNWAVHEIDEPGLSLFFLNETAGWMVTPRGIWFTEEAGRTWKRILKKEGLTRVHFISPERGWAIGAEKTVLQTVDGGRKWTKLPEAEKLSTSKENTHFSSMDFMSPQVGIIVGRSRSPRRQDLPIWMDPDAKTRREWPALSVFLQTNDGGATWKENKSSLFGRLSKISLAPAGRGLLLVEFDEFFDYPSELYSTDLKTGTINRVLRRKDFAVTDVEMDATGLAFVAGFQPTGLLTRSPVPGKLRISSSRDLQKWADFEVDYRAVARRVMLSVVDADHVWAATDTGMILRLQN